MRYINLNKVCGIVRDCFADILLALLPTASNSKNYIL